MKNSLVVFSIFIFFAIQAELTAQPLQETFVSASRHIRVEELASTEMQQLFPDMVDGIVYQGGKETARRLNYHVLFGLFYTHDRRSTRVYLRPDGIDSIRAGDMVFRFFHGDGYFQVISTANEALLLKRHSVDVLSETVTVGAYGSTSRSASAQSVETLVQPGMGDFVDRTVLLENPAGQELHVTLRRQESFYLLKDGSPVRVNNRRALLREFSEHRSDLRGFLREHDIDFSDEADMVRLAAFIYSL